MTNVSECLLTGAHRGICAVNHLGVEVIPEFVRGRTSDVQARARSPKPALESRAEPEPCSGLEVAWGSGFNFSKPKPWA